MDDNSFSSYRSGRSFTYHGGFWIHSPVRIVVPSTGNWNWALDLGGGSASIRYGVSYLKQS